MTDRRTVRVVASDLDGTLLGADGRLSVRTITALRAARAAGITVIAATGRAPTSAMPLLAPHGVVDALICSNGSIVHDVERDVTVERFPIDAEHLGALFSALDAAIPGLSFCWETDNGCGWDEGFHHIATAHDDLRMFDAGPRPAPGTPVTKVMAHHRELQRGALADVLRPHLPAALTLGCSGVSFVEVTGQGVDKSTALAYVIGRDGGRATDVVAFGDNDNDVEMLAWAGHGVAVANASEAAVHAADETIGHHARDSVAAYIESLL